MSQSDPLKPYYKYLVMFLLNLGVVAGVLYLVRPQEPHPVVVTRPPTRATVNGTPEPGTPITVTVEGAVNRTGDLQLPDGARVADALQKAGVKPEADVSQLDLTETLHDGETIMVPGAAPSTRSTLAAASTPNANSVVATSPSETLTVPAATKKVNINTATLDELIALPAIGPTLAQRILDYRAKNGNFKSIDELNNVKGIGDKLLAKLRERITVQ